MSILSIGGDDPLGIALRFAAGLLALVLAAIGLVITAPLWLPLECWRRGERNIYQ